MSGAGKTPIYGPERWMAKHGMTWSHWDLWFCLVALADHDGDLNALAEPLEERGRLSGGVARSRPSSPISTTSSAGWRRRTSMREQSLPARRLNLAC